MLLFELQDMDQELEKAYKPAPLDAYSLRQRAAIHLADLVFFFLIAVIGRTLRFDVDGQEHFDAVEGSGKVPILTFWHDRIFSSTYYFRNRRIVVMTSQSFDGEYIARFIQRFGYGAARGSSTRGGIGALIEMIKLVRAGAPCAFTVDGPKGPRYEAKVGPCLLSKKSGAPILPFVIETSGYWCAKSWDRLQIPKPFSKAKIFFAPPIMVDEKSEEEEINTKRDELQTALDALVEKGRIWRESV